MENTLKPWINKLTLLAFLLPAIATGQLVTDRNEATSVADTDVLYLVNAGGTADWKLPFSLLRTELDAVLADGSVPLTANWDAGAYTITGTQFISDIAIGTAPFVVTSTTQVANLNAATAGNADTVTTNANLTGHVTSTGNAAVLGSFDLSQLNTALSDATLADGAHTTALEGTAILSTGEVGGVKFLREDGDNTSSWQALPASGAFEADVDTQITPSTAIVLDHASNNEIALDIEATVNKIAGNDTLLRLNQIDTAPPGTSLLADVQVGGVSKFSVNNAGTIVTAGGNLNTGSDNTALQLLGKRGAVNGDGVAIISSTGITGVSGHFNALNIKPVYNQASGTASNTDLLINRTGTAVGSGSQYVIAAQVGGVSKFNVNNAGDLTLGGFKRIYASQLAASANVSLVFQNGVPFTSPSTHVVRALPSLAQTSGTAAILSLEPTYNQASGTAANTDLLINRTETAVGSGAQLLQDWQVGSVSLANIDNAGQLTLDPAGSFGNTTGLAFGDGDSGIYESADDILTFNLVGLPRINFSGGYIYGTGANRFAINLSGVGATTPAYTKLLDEDTGVGFAAADQLSLIAGGVEGIRLSESGGVTIQYQINAGLTADVSSVQGGLPLTSSYNELSTVANAGDAATLQSAAAGIRVTIMNNGANAADIFPASGDDLGAGVDTAASLAAGSNITYFAIDSTNWETL